MAVFHCIGSVTVPSEAEKRLDNGLAKKGESDFKNQAGILSSPGEVFFSFSIWLNTERGEKKFKKSAEQLVSFRRGLTYEMSVLTRA